MGEGLVSYDAHGRGDFKGTQIILGEGIVADTDQRRRKSERFNLVHGEGVISNLCNG